MVFPSLLNQLGHWFWFWKALSILGKNFRPDQVKITGAECKIIFKISSSERKDSALHSWINKHWQYGYFSAFLSLFNYSAEVSANWSSWHELHYWRCFYCSSPWQHHSLEKNCLQASNSNHCISDSGFWRVVHGIMPLMRRVLLHNGGFCTKSGTPKRCLHISVHFQTNALYNLFTQRLHEKSGYENYITLFCLKK